MLKKFLFIVLFIASLSPLNAIHAQLSAKDSLLHTAAVKNLVATYHKNIGDQTGKYNGSQNAGYTVSFYD